MTFGISLENTDNKTVISQVGTPMVFKRKLSFQIPHATANSQAAYIPPWQGIGEFDQSKPPLIFFSVNTAIAAPEKGVAVMALGYVGGEWKIRAVKSWRAPADRDITLPLDVYVFNQPATPPSGWGLATYNSDSSPAFVVDDELPLVLVGAPTINRSADNYSGGNVTPGSGSVTIPPAARVPDLAICAYNAYTGGTFWNGIDQSKLSSSGFSRTSTSDSTLTIEQVNYDFDSVFHDFHAMWYSTVIPMIDGSVYT